MNEIREQLGEVDGFVLGDTIYRRSDGHPELWRVYRTDELHITTDELIGNLKRLGDYFLDHYYTFTEVRSETDPV